MLPEPINLTLILRINNIWLFISKLCLHLPVVVWPRSAFVVLLFFPVSNLLWVFSGRPQAFPAQSTDDTQRLSCWATGRGSSSPIPQTQIFIQFIFIYIVSVTIKAVSLRFTEIRSLTPLNKQQWKGKPPFQQEEPLSRTRPIQGGRSCWRPAG